MHEGLWNQLDKLDIGEIANKAKCTFTSNGNLSITMLSSVYTVDIKGRLILKLPEPGVQAGFIEQLCILSWLIGARDIPISGNLVTPETLPGGAFFFRGVHGLRTEALADAFGSAPEDIYEAGAKFGAVKREFSDASIEIRVLPRLPIVFVVFRGDDEFPARASVLFDKTAKNHLPLDALMAATHLTVAALVKSKTQF